MNKISSYLDKKNIEKKYKITKFIGNGVGFSEPNQKWYGWSHRAIYGFGIGSKVKAGDCGYVPKDKHDQLKQAIRFWSDPHKVDVKGEFVKDPKTGKEQIYVSWKYDDKVKNEKIRGSISGVYELILKDFGRGEWTAKTLEDAKQMAIDFSNGVS